MSLLLEALSGDGAHLVQQLDHSPKTPQQFRIQQNDVAYDLLAFRLGSLSPIYD
jgi:hypothetical protein